LPDILIETLPQNSGMNWRIKPLKLEPALA
jgi:hypothetical protein